MIVDVRLGRLTLQRLIRCEDCCVADITNHPRVRLFASDSSVGAYAIRDYLTRSVVDFDWVRPEGAEFSAVLDGVKDDLPVVQFPDGDRLIAPNLEQIADKLGWVTKPRRKEYDLSIYGAGPAGLSAAVYAASEGLSVVLVEKEAVGGQAGSSSLIENYLGFPSGIRGAELAERARQQAVEFGAELLLMREGIKGEFRDGRIRGDLADGTELVARANICATGVDWRRLGLPRESEFLGRGFYYGAGTSEASQCVGEEVFVVGGANSAGQAALNLSATAAHVTMLVRGPQLADTMSAYLTSRIAQAPNITVRTSSEITALEGDGRIRAIDIRDSARGTEDSIPASRVFVCIGGSPDTEWTRGTGIVRDRLGYLVTGPDLLPQGKLPGWTLDRDPFYLETSVPGSFAAGDVRHNSVKRVASAVGEGAMAVTFVHHYLKESS